MARLSDITKGQGRELDRVLEAGGLDGDLALTILDKPALARIMVEAARAHLAAEARKAETFEGEQAESTYGYPNGWQLKPLGEQARILAERFPGLDVSHVDELAARYYVDSAGGDEGNGGYRDAPKKGKRLVLPRGMDGLVVIPKPSAIARLASARCKRQKVEMPDWPTVNVALWGLLGVMSAARSDFLDCTERNVSPKRYRLTKKTKKAYAAFGDLPGGVMVLAVQTGFLHRGKSVRRARVVFGEHEFGLCAFAVGCILLTHPERLTHVDHLWIDCAGAEFAPGFVDGFSRCPCCCFRDGRLEFGWEWIDVPGSRCGSASGCSPECQS